MNLHHLRSVDGFIAFDLDCPVSAGGTRYADDVSESEARLLARAMTYKFGVLGREVGGAKACIRGTPAEKAAVMASYCAEIAPMVRSGRFLTAADLGTQESDFASLRDPDAPPSLMASAIGGVAIEDLVTGFGVVAAAAASMERIEGTTWAIEGLGKVGGGVAREAARRGARIVSVATIEGCVTSPSGFDVEALLALRNAHGDGFVHHAGAQVAPPHAVYASECDVIVPGARTGVLTAEVAGELRAPWIVPAANVPYTSDGIEVMRARRVRFLPDFVCNAGATIGFTCGATSPGELFAAVDRTITELISRASAWPTGPFDGACAIAEGYIATWNEVPDGRPVA